MQQMVSLLQILFLAQHVSGTIMPIIKSSRVLYRWLLPAVFGALVFKLSVWCRAVGFVSSLGLCPSSGAQEYYTGVCCLRYLVLWFSSCRSGAELLVVCLVCRMLQHPANWTHNQQLYTRPTTSKPKHQIPQAATNCIILLSS